MLSSVVPPLGDHPEKRKKPIKKLIPRLFNQRKREAAQQEGSSPCAGAPT